MYNAGQIHRKGAVVPNNKLKRLKPNVAIVRELYERFRTNTWLKHWLQAELYALQVEGLGEGKVPLFIDMKLAATNPELALAEAMRLRRIALEQSTVVAESLQV